MSVYDFICTMCYKTYPIIQQSKQIFQGDPVCKMCDGLFEVLPVGDEDVDEDEERAILTAEEVICEEHRFD